MVAHDLITLTSLKDFLYLILEIHMAFLIQLTLVLFGFFNPLTSSFWSTQRHSAYTSSLFIQTNG